MLARPGIRSLEGIISLALLVGVIYWVVNDPTSAAALVTNLLGLLESAANSAVSFFSSVTA